MIYTGFSRSMFKINEAPQILKARLAEALNLYWTNFI